MTEKPPLELLGDFYTRLRIQVLTESMERSIHYLRTMKLAAGALYSNVPQDSVLGKDIGAFFVQITDLLDYLEQKHTEANNLPKTQEEEQGAEVVPPVVH